MRWCNSWRLVVIMLALTSATLACTLGSSPDVTTESILEDPLVVILAPVNGSVFAEGVEVNFYAIAQDTGPGATRLEFRVDDVPVGDVTAEQLDGQPSLEGRLIWRAAGKAGHLITVEAFRADGASLGMSDITIRVIDRPVAQLPVDGAPVGEGGDDAAAPIPTLTPAPTMPVLAGVPAQVITAELNVRQGPGTGYPVVGTLHEGDRIEVVGRNADSTWWAIPFRSGTAWVFADLVQPEGDVSQVPLVAAP